MSNRNNMIPIPGRLHSVAVGEPVSGADEVLDDALNMEQSEINQLTVGTKNASTGTIGAYPYNGMGRVVLPKNMVNGVNTLTQDMLYKGDLDSRVPNTNTIFVIQYDFVLGEDITIPDNCVLEFEGGSIANSTGKDYYIDGNNGSFNQDASYKIFDNVVFKNFALEYIDIRWFGAKSAKTVTDATEDSAPYFQAAMDMCEFYQCIPIKVIGIYRIKSTVICNNHFQLFGNNYTTRAFHYQVVESTPESLIVVDNNTTAFHIKGHSMEGSNITYCSFNIHNIKFVGYSISTNNCVLFKVTTSGGPSRPCSISQCEILGFEKAIQLDYDETCTSGTMLGVVSISQCNIYACGSMLYTEDCGDYATLCDLHIYDNLIEQCWNSAIVLRNIFSYSHIENNMFESNANWNIYIPKSIKTCIIEINGNYSENQDKFVSITGDSNNWNTEYPTITTVDIYNNYFFVSNGVSNGQSTIELKYVYIKSIDELIYYKNDSVFLGCYFDKLVNIKDIPISCLGDWNVFEEMPIAKYPVFLTLPMYKTDSSDNNVDVLGGRIMNLNALRSEYKTPTTGVTTNDEAIFVGYIGTRGGKFQVGYGSPMDTFAYMRTIKGGYVLRKIKYTGSGDIYAEIGGRAGFSYTTKTGISVTVIELKKYTNLQKVGDIMVAENVINSPSKVVVNDPKTGVEAFANSLGMPIIYNNAWIGTDGFTATSKKGTTRPVGKAAGGLLEKPRDIGFQFFDTNSDVNKPIYIKDIHSTNGTVTWVDATGTPV